MKSIDEIIFKIEDYVGGNIEGNQTGIDRMGFTVFLRRTLTELLDEHEQQLLSTIKAGLPGKKKRIMDTDDSSMSEFEGEKFCVTCGQYQFEDYEECFCTEQNRTLKAVEECLNDLFGVKK